MAIKYGMLYEPRIRPVPMLRGLRTPYGLSLELSLLRIYLLAMQSSTLHCNRLCRQVDYFYYKLQHRAYQTMTIRDKQTRPLQANSNMDSLLQKYRHCTMNESIVTAGFDTKGESLPLRLPWVLDPMLRALAHSWVVASNWVCHECPLWNLCR